MDSVSVKINDLKNSVSVNSLDSNNWSKLIKYDSFSNEPNFDINNDISIISPKDYYKNKYFNLEKKYNNLINQYENLKKIFLEITNILNSINSYKIIPSIKEPINKIKKLVLESNDIIKYPSNKNINKKYNDDDNIISNENNIRIFFSSVDKKIHYSILCKDTDKFEKIENLLYDKYPQFKESKNIFISNGNNIKSNKTIKENKIKDGDMIVLYNEKNVQDKLKE